MCCTHAQSAYPFGGTPPSWLRPHLSDGPLGLAPVLQRERRVGDDAVELGQVVAGVEGGVAQGVLADDLEVLDAVEQQVHPGDGGGGEHLLLAVELAPQGLGAAAGRLDVLDDLDEHAAGAAGRVVDGLALLRVEDVDQEADHRARGVVLAGLLVRLVGEPLDEVLVRVAEHVRRTVRVGQRLGREVLDQVGQLAVGQLVLVGPVGVAEDAVERLRVGLLDLAERGLQGACRYSRCARARRPRGCRLGWRSGGSRRRRRTRGRRRTPPAPARTPPGRRR